MNNRSIFDPRSLVVLAVAANALANPAFAIPIAGQGTWETTLQARDYNGDGIADAFYDTTLDITWVADVLYPKSTAFDPDGNGLVSYADAVAWTASLDLGGTTGWRLPKYEACCHSELYRLYYDTLGNTGQTFGSGGPIDGSGFANTANFRNVTSGFYLLGTDPLVNATDPTTFEGDPLSGYDFRDATEFGSFWPAWAVHDGDVPSVVAPAVPEPQTWALLFAGLALVGVKVRATRRPR